MNDGEEDIPVVEDESTAWVYGFRYGSFSASASLMDYANIGIVIGANPACNLDLTIYLVFFSVVVAWFRKT